MPRIPLPELQDYAFCPRLFRDAITTLMRFAIDRLRIYDPVIPLLRQLLAHSPAPRIIDLCSGGAGPWGRLAQTLTNSVGEPIPIVLTDKYPNLSAFAALQAEAPQLIQTRSQPVDATAVPAELVGVRTLFSSFHHFSPPQARQILTDAVARQAPIGIFEFTERSLPACLGMLGAPLVALLVIPLLPPRSLARLLSCVPLPIVPLLATWDGFASNLRSYSQDELWQLTSELATDNYHFQVGRLTARLRLPVTYLIGYPSQPPHPTALPSAIPSRNVD